MKPKLVRLNIVDVDAECNENVELATFLLVNPDKDKLDELKHMIEFRYTYDTDDLTDEEIAAKEEFRDFIWDTVEKFINDNFVVLETDEYYEIEY